MPWNVFISKLQAPNCSVTFVQVAVYGHWLHAGRTAISCHLCVCVSVNYSYNKSNQTNKFLKFIFGIKLYMFQTVLQSIIRSFSLYTQQQHMLTACSQAVSKPVWHIPLLCVQWKTPDDGQRNCLKHVKFYSKNKFEKLVHLVRFIVRNKSY